MPFTLENRVLPSYAVPDGVPESERRCPACPPYVVRCAHDPDPEHEGRVAWIVDSMAWAAIPCPMGHAYMPDYSVCLGVVLPCVGRCGSPALHEVYEMYKHHLPRDDADAAFERMERVMLGREPEEVE